MFVLQNIRDYLDNPMGKGSNALMSRQLIRDDLRNRYEKLDKSKKIKMKAYRAGSDYYFHVFIPSEDIERDNTYDVVIKFLHEKELVQTSIADWKIQIFSNSPGFTYTYAYVCALNGILVEELAAKFDRMVLTNPPVTRNPGEIINYEKTTFFAMQHLLDNPRLFNKLYLDSIATSITKRGLQDIIRNSDRIKVEIDLAKRKVQRNKAKEKARSSNTSTTRSARGSIAQGKGPNSNDPTKMMNRGKITARSSSKKKIGRR